jgi:hypothetical protein
MSVRGAVNNDRPYRDSFDWRDRPLKAMKIPASGAMVVAEWTGVVLGLERLTPSGSLTRNALDAQISVRPWVAREGACFEQD